MSEDTVTRRWVPNYVAMTTPFLIEVYIYIERESNIDIVRALGLRTALTTKWAQQQLTIIPDCHLDVFLSLRGSS